MHCLSFQRISALALCFVLSFAALALPQENALMPEMVVDLQRVTQVALNPMGETVAFVVSTPRTEGEDPGRAYSELWVTSISGGDPRQYTAKPTSSSAVAWSPDGVWLTFLSKRAGQDEFTQIYKMRVDGGEASRVTEHGSSIVSYRWAPDGRSIAFVAADEQTEEEKKAKKAGRDWKVYDENFKHRRLWILDIESGETRQAYESNLSVWRFVWTPDSKQMILQASQTPLIDDSYVFTKIYRASATGRTPELLCNTEGKLGPMAVSSDGTQLAFLGAVSLNDPLAQTLFTVSLQGGEPRNLTSDLQLSGQSVAWADDKMLLLLSAKGSQTAVSRVNTNDGKTEHVVDSGPIVQSLDLDARSGRFAAVAHSSTHPPEVYAGSVKDGKMIRLTYLNPELKSVKLARQEVIEWKGADGWPIEGVLTYPLNYRQGQRYPLVLQIHGGPEGVSLNGWSTSSGYPVQVLAAEGYLVLQPNYRGSGGRGVDFSKADHDDLGGKEFDDVLAGVDALIERGLADGNRVGTGGWSYGGYFSAWAATRHNERFKASVVAAGISNWISFAGTTDIPHEMSLVHWNSYWYDQRDLHWERSPAYYIDKASTPTMIVHGMADERVHPEQGIQLYTALKLKKIPTKLVLYPRQPHGLRERAHQLDFIKRTVEWFNLYLKRGGTN
ncbi:S9 family peptidase [bacterium]|nr:S9 family peptidase [bacterium]